MDIGIVNLGHVEDLENTAIRKYEEHHNKETKRSFSEYHYKKEKWSGRRGKLRTLLDISVFKVPTYTIAMVSLLLMNFGHYIPQMHLVSRSVTAIRNTGGSTPDNLQKMFC